MKSFFSLLLRFPITFFIFTTLVVIGIGSFSLKLEIDASSETLLLEDDSDLKFAREVARRYESPDFLVVTFSPKDALLSQKSLETLSNLSKDLEALNRVSSVTSILNAPLFESPVRPIKELVKDMRTLQSKGVDKVLVKKEFLSSPLYKNNLVSSDFKTTALVLNLTPDDRFHSLVSRRNFLTKKQEEGVLTSKEEKELVRVQKDFKLHRDAQREIEHQSILQVRSILKTYRKEVKLFLGGVNMIADDMITFVKNDVVIYGSTLLILLIITLWVIFRQFRWVLLPVIICIYSVVATTGILGFFGWEITVISSNFISLQLIITISIVLHLIVRYRELALKFPSNSQYKLVMITLLSKMKPSFFAIVTTIVGFGSLLLSGIKPIINLGYMMSAGIAISLVISFILFGAIVVKLPKLKPRMSFEKQFGFTKFCAWLAISKGRYIVIASAIILAIGLSGASLLKVENSFISYFKPTTEIYKGMEVIDTKLGGTTPLDVIVTFAKEESASEDGEFDEFEEEFAEKEDEAQYWFTPEKMAYILKVHEYLETREEVGNVQSFATLLKVGYVLNENKDLDNFQLAILYNELPDKFKKLVLNPYVNIEANQVRFSTRVVDSNEELRRDEFLRSIEKDLKTILPQEVATYRLSGLMVLYNNMLQTLYKSQILTLGVVVLSLFIMFWLLFRSIKVASIAIISNIIPMSIIFGFMGWYGIPLDMMTITIAAISIGIGVDDTIHYIHRFKDELKRDGDYAEAIRRSHSTIGYAMYYTSFAIMLGFSVLVVSNFIPTIYFGLLTVLVMFMVLLGALLLLPRLLLITKPY